MLVGIQKLPLRYKEGTVLTSAQSKIISSSHFHIEVPVGSTITVFKDIEKIQITHQIKDIIIDHYFIRYKGTYDLIPIYLKIYDQDTASVLILAKGTQQCLNDLSGQSKKLNFLVNLLFEVVYNEVDIIDKDLYDSLLNFVDVPSFRYDIHNDTATITKSDHILDDKVDYPWNLGDFRSRLLTTQMRNLSDVSTSTELSPQTVANYVCDLYYQVGSTENSFGLNVLSDVLDKYFNPDLCINYGEIAFDNFTAITIENKNITPKDLKYCGIRDLYPVSKMDLPKNEDIEYITVFNSSLLHFCVWLHQLPLSEFAFRYILPSQNQQDNLKWYYAHSKVKTKISFLDIYEELSHLTSIWKDDIFNVISVQKFDTEEVLISLEGVEKRLIYVDLFMTTLLSQGISRS